MDANDEKVESIRNFIFERTNGLRSTDTNHFILSLCRDIISQLSAQFSTSAIIDDEDLSMVLDDAIIEDSFSHEKFASDLATLIVRGLTREQKIAKLLMKVDGYRYYCNCDLVDWDGLKETIADFVREV